jgi:translocation and assembly module TamB
VKRPEGRVLVEMSHIEWRSGAGALLAPPVDEFQLELLLMEERMRVERFQLLVREQLVQVHGEWPLGLEVWRALWEEGTVPRWEDASAEVQVVDAELAPFARYLPDVLSAQGRLNLNLLIRPGGRMEGELVITNAATRAVGALAPIRDIEAQVRFEERTATIERFGGQIGGQPVEVTGQIQLTEEGRAAFDLEIGGQNVPLVRQPGLLLRSDLQVRLQSGIEGQAVLTGDVRLRDGLYLQDITSLMGGRLERPAMRPPYFSVTNEPFGDWRLDLRVHGDEFLRIRMPVFAGMLSGDGRLRGTMRAPVITGDVRVRSGRVLFPFGTLRVDQGYATLSEDAPRGPVVTLAAEGRNYRYNVRLEIEGPADAPVVLFSSTPPLTSEEILLMLTAGELPQREIVYSTEARVGRLATYLGREMVTRFVGDETAEQRLIINSGENIAEDGKTTYSIEYKLDPRWSIVGEYDRFNALNVGLKWKLFSR